MEIGRSIHTKRQQRLFAKIQEEIRGSFNPTSELAPNYRRMLEFLELRAHVNGGDCKASDEKLANNLNISLKTVQRGFAKLEERGYVTRMTDLRRDGKYKTCSSRNSFYCIRVIRCNRVFLASGGQVKTAYQLGWKTDASQRIHAVPNFNGKFAYRDEEEWVNTAVGPVPTFVKKRAVTEDDLDKLNVMSWNFKDKFDEMREAQGNCVKDDRGVEFGSECIGYREEKW